MAGRPFATARERLRVRAEVTARIRAFFAERAVVEVETPTLSAAAVTDTALRSIACEVAALGGRHYLRTSPELAMKRLIAAGSGDIFELGPVYRDGELGRWHQPEFLLLEWYRVGYDEHALMDEVLALLERVLAPRRPELAAMRVRYADAFAEIFGVDAHRLDAAGRARLTEALTARGIDVPAELGANALLDLALSQVVVPSWPKGGAVFLHDYPAAQAALAAIGPGDPPVARRFEVFVDGIELGNGFYELTDAVEQRRRFEADLAARRAEDRPAPPIDEAFLAALEAGLPDCAGVAIGVDRLIAVLVGAESLADVVNFPR
jgi:lysyl-tRNA synthetase class 2